MGGDMKMQPPFGAHFGPKKLLPQLKRLSSHSRACRIFLVLQRRGRPEPGPKKAHFYAFIFTCAIVHSTRTCRTELGSGSFAKNLFAYG